MTAREELEARLTALLLGELPDDEAAALRQTIAEDAELARLHDRLQQAIGLVRETVAAPETEIAAITDTPKLAAERREKLLASFKAAQTKELQQSHWRNVNWGNVKWQEFAAMAAMFMALLGVGVTLLTTSVQQSRLGLDLAYGEAPAKTTSIPGRGMTVPPPPAPLPVQSPAPEVAARQTLERSPRHLAGIALPAMGDALQANSEGVNNGRDKERVADPSQVAQSDFFQGVNASDSGLFAKDISGPVSTSAPAAPTPDTAAKSLGARFGDLPWDESLNVVTKGGVAGAAVETSDLSRSETSRRGFLSTAPTAPPVAPIPRPMPAPVAAPRPDSLEDIIQLKNDNYAAYMVVTNGFVASHLYNAGKNFAPTAQDGRAGVVPQDSLAFGLNVPQAPQFSFSSRLNQGRGRVANEPGSAVNSPASPGDPSALGVFSQEAVGYINVDLSKENILAGKPDTDSDGANRAYWRRNIGSPTTDAKDAAVESKKLAGISKSEYTGVTPPVALHFDAETDPAGSKSKRESGRALGETLKPAQQPAEEAKLRKSRVDIALPKGERGEAREAFQVATGPVAASEIQQHPLEAGRISLEGLTRLPELQQKLDSIRLSELSADSLPLGQVIEELNRKAKEADPAKKGINLIVDNTADPAALPPAAVELTGITSFLSSKRRALLEPATGLPVEAAVSAVDDLAATTIKIDRPLRDVTLGQALDIISKSADRPINLSLDQNGVVISAGDKVQQELNRRKTESSSKEADLPLPKLAPGAAVPQPEVSTAENSFSTFSLNVSDVSFKLAAASLEKGQMPDPATVRSEEFINAFDYRDSDPKGSAPIAFAWERARYPFAHDRDLVRFSVKTAASGRQPGRPLNLVLLLDNSGSMERADRVRIIQECLRVLAGQLQAQDRVSVVAFARTARLWVDGMPGNQAGELQKRVGDLTPQGGTNLEDAMNLAYQTALRHYLAHGVNRVVLLTDGAANLGDVQPESLKKKVEAHRKQGIALDCFGIGWEGFNDDLLETLSRNGDGRYGFVNTPEAATSEFASQLAGALKVAASDVKVQVEFNPRRATAYRQIGYAKHQLKKEQFRDNTVDAAEIGAAEAGNALYVVQVNPAGEGPIGTVRVRFKVPGTSDYREHEWPVPYEGAARSLEQSSAALRLAASASAFSEWLVSSPYAGEVTPDKLLGYLNGVPETWPADPRPKKLEWMIRQARSVAGK